MLYPFFGKNTIVSKPDNSNILTLDEIKEYLNIPLTFTSKDAELTRLLNSAIEEVYDICQMGLLNTTYKCLLYGFHNFKVFNQYYCNTANVFRIKKQLIHTINYIKYYENNIQLTLPITDYALDTKPYYAEILSINDTGYPSVDRYTNNLNKLGAVEVEYITGFGDDKSDIPSKLISAILAYISYYYNNKGDCNGCSGGINNNQQFMNLIGEYSYYDL